MMTLDQLALAFRRGRDITLPRLLVQIANSIGEAATVRAAAKLGTYQPAVGPFNAWEPLKPATIERKGFDSPLIREGRMQNSLNFNIDQEGSKFIVHLTSSQPYAGYQEYGSPNGRIPPRPFMGPALYEEAKEQADEIGAALAYGMLDPGVVNALFARRASGKSLVGAVLARRRALRSSSR